LNPDEFIISTTHEEMDLPVRVVVRRYVIHGIETHILAERTVCCAGLMIATGWSSQAIRSYGSRMPGRCLARKRASAHQARRRPPAPPSRRGRRAPLPLEFNVKALMGWIYMLLEPMPRHQTEFAKLIAVIARRVEHGDPLADLLRTYGEELSAYINVTDENVLS
jgi:hypothetical protein